jgi:hypothetical protein
MGMSNELPNKLSETILVALADVEKVRANPAYRLNLLQWHEPSPLDPNLCVVCFAGAVMSQSLGVKHGDDATPGSHFNGDTAEKLALLNDLRAGEVSTVIAYWPDPSIEAAKSDSESAPPVDYYSSDDLDSLGQYAKFREQMTALASWLAERGA